MIILALTKGKDSNRDKTTPIVACHGVVLKGHGLVLKVGTLLLQV